MPTNAEYLSRVPLFAGLAPDRLDALASACQRRALAKGEVLFLEGDPGGALFVIVSGNLRVERIGANGGVQVLGIRRAGEVIGEMSLVDQSPRSAQVVGQSAAKLLVVSRRAFVEHVLPDPAASLAIMGTLAERIRLSDQLLLNLRTREVADRLEGYLLSQADLDGIVRLGMTQATLAEHLGCTREAANRAFGELKASGRLEQFARGVYRIRAASSE